MKYNLPKFGISGVVLVIILAIVALFSLYFFVLIDDKQEALEKDGFRILEKLGTNMKEKDSTASNVAYGFNRDNWSDTISTSPFLGHGPILGILSKGTTTNIKSFSYTSKKLGNLHILPGNFIKPLLRRDFFSEYIFVQDGKIYFSTFTGDMQFADSNLFSGSSGPKRAESWMDGLSGGNPAKNKSSVIQGGTIHQITYEGTSYLLFIIPFEFQNKSKCYLGGFIEENKFTRDKRSLPSDLIVVFIIIFLLIFFSLPVLKVFIIGPREKLTRAGVTMIGLSVVTGTLLIGIILSQQLIRFTINSDHFKQLTSLSQAVKNAFIIEKDTILLQLKQYNQKKVDFGKLGKLNYSVLDSSGKMNEPDLKPFYPFFKSVFWAGKNGEQKTLFTPLKYGINTNVKNRAYFIHPDRYKCSSGWYNMEPIYSHSTGDWSIAFSVPSKDNAAKAVVLTSPMYSLKSPVLQQGFEYCLIDKTGRIWYHSNELLDLNDNLLIESHDNPSLKAALRNNDNACMEIDIRNMEYRACLSPVESTDLFVISLVNPARTKSISAITASFVLFFFSVVFFILLLVFIILRILKVNKSKLAGKEYLFNLILPDKEHYTIYFFLISLNGLIFTLLMVLKLKGCLDEFSVSDIMYGLIVLIITHSLATFLVLSSRCKELKNRKSVTMSHVFLRYSGYVVSWLLVIIIMPVILLSSIILHTETTNYIQSQQQFLAQSLNKRTEMFHKFYQYNISGKQYMSLFRERNQKGLYFTSIYGTKLKWQDPGYESNGKQNTSRVLKSARYLFDKIMDETDPISPDPLIGSKFDKYSNLKDTMLFSRVEYYERTGKLVQKSILSADNPWPGIFNPFRTAPVNTYAIIFWSFIIVMTMLIGILVHNLIKFLFFSYDLSCTRPLLTEELNRISESKINALIISDDTPNPEPKSHGGWKIADLDEPKPGDFNDPANGLILLNFESGIDLLENISTRLMLLENLNEKNILFILWLDKTPEQILAKYKDSWVQQNGSLKDLPALSHFLKLVSSLPRIYPEIERPARNIKGYCSVLSSILLAESKFNPGIRQFYLLIQQDIESHCGENDRHCKRKQLKKVPHCLADEFLVLKIQELSIPFYEQKWASLSEDEQFILLDLAQDTLLNLKNKKPITLLFKKGILCRNEQIDFVSQSFKNYILTDIDKASFEKIQKKIEQEGTWHRFSVPLILIATSLAVFLFITQQNFLSNLNTMLVSAGALLGVYAKVSGMFTKTKEPG